MTEQFENNRIAWHTAVYIYIVFRFDLPLTNKSKSAHTAQGPVFHKTVKAELRQFFCWYVCIGHRV